MHLNKNEDKNTTNMDELHVESSSKEESIRVCTRIRPLFEKEVNSGHLKAWKMNDTDMELVVEPLSLSEMLNARIPKKGNKLEVKKTVEKTEGQKSVLQRHYAFDRCFDDHVGNEEVYRHLARDIILDTFKGINGCILAYGQTGSGKTHSIMGVPADPGMLPRSLAEFFNGIENPSSLNEENASSNTDDESNNNTKEFLMSVTYLEVYMERVNDLLQEGYRGGAIENLDVKEDPKRGFVVIGIQEETVTSIDEVMLLVAKAEQRRHISQTNFNETSSRSHTIFTVILESNQVLSNGTSINKRGELKIVDLAGNERAGRAAEGIENAKTLIEEGKSINKSLFVLSEVISKLSKRAQAIALGDEKKIKKIQEDLVFIPWRDSKLTRILSKSLGGNCRASVIVAVHPSHFYLDTSFSTLRFALKCKTIKKKIEVNYLSAEQSVIMQQKELIAKLQNQLKHLSTSKNTDINAHVGDKDYISNRDPENDEKILALKNELEEKVKKFQNFILKSDFHVSSNNYRRLRSIDDDNNYEKLLKYSMTISTNIKNEYNWLRSFDTHEYDFKSDGIEKYENQNAKEKFNISKAMDYLKNKSPYKMNSSEISNIDALSNESQKDDSISLNYYNELDELEKLELKEAPRKKKKDKSGGNNVNHNASSVHKIYDELSKLSTMEYNNYIEEEREEAERRKKEKIHSKGAQGSKKKKGKHIQNNALSFYNKDNIDSSKMKGKKQSTNNLKKKKTYIVSNAKNKRDLYEKSMASTKHKLEDIGTGEYVSLIAPKDENIDLDNAKDDDSEKNREQTDNDDEEGNKTVDINEEEDVKNADTRSNKSSFTQNISKHSSSLYLCPPKGRINNEKRTSIISNLKRKIGEDLKKKKKIMDRNVELNNQIKFIMKLMQKVGLSTILTGVVPPGRNLENVLKLQENLKDDLKIHDNKKSLEILNEKVINNGAYGNVIYNTPSSQKKGDGKKNVKDDDEDEASLLNGYFDFNNNNEIKYNENISHVFINEMFFSFLLRIQQKQQAKGNNNNGEDNEKGESLNNMEEMLKKEEKPYDVSKKALEDILGSTISNKIAEKEDDTLEFSKIIKDEKNKNTIDSILSMLTPWEQKILALLYEQKKMREQVQKIKEKFSQRIKNINIFIKKILIDKIEVEKHFNRIVKVTEQYKEDMLKTSDVDSNFKFAGLMKKLEELSISLSEKTRDFNVLAEFHLNLRKENEKKDTLIKELQEENKLFYLVPKYNELLNELNGNEENPTAVKELKKEFLLMYGRLMITKKKLQEKEIIESDIRNLNKHIYTELIESISIIKNLESQNKFLEYKLNLENKKKVEKVKKLLNEKEKLNKVISEMERMLEEANIDTSTLKNEILSNFNNTYASINNIDSEEDKPPKEVDTNKKENKAKKSKKKKKKRLGMQNESKENDSYQNILEYTPKRQASKNYVHRGYSGEKITKNATTRINTGLRTKKGISRKKTYEEKNILKQAYGSSSINDILSEKKMNKKKKNLKKNIDIDNNNSIDNIQSLQELKSSNSIGKKSKRNVVKEKKKNKKKHKKEGKTTINLDGINMSNELKSSNNIIIKKNKKNKNKTEKESILKYVNNGDQTIPKSALTEENKFNTFNSGNSITNIETNKMRDILNKELAKKRIKTK
ncbi:kinesin-7, putative [Plasmodium chabaudi chabaudi]|uniref:Kinesin-7, putative n=1 Tax=Plasmodium chabaudi chabaudi TaxID=31271 RepID=A0A1D3RSF3_PLACU|nr:kinesin-7, putative [Plasmodium chabaudi chabaudi]